MMSCIVSVARLVVNQGYECYKYGTYTPLLYHDDEMIPILEKVAECEKINAYFELGNMRALAIDEVAFASLLKVTRDELKTLAMAVKSPISKKLLMDKLSRIELIDANVQTRMTTGGLKGAPFTVGIFGPSSVGKTSVNNIIVASLLRAMGVSYKDRDRIKLNPMDQFASGAHNGLTAITIDEMGQVKEKFVGENPIQMLFMQLGNNEVTPLNMAEVNLKGKIAPRPVVMTTTKNVKDNAARTLLNEPIACVRREHYILTVMVRDQFATNGFLDSGKIVAFYGRCPVVPDAWQIRVERVVAQEGKPITSNTNIIKTEFSYEVAVDRKGKELSSASIYEVLEFLIEEGKDHYELQQQIIAANTEIGARIPFCDVHRQLCRTCGCEPAPSVAPSSVSTNSVSTITDDSVVTIEPKRSWFRVPSWPSRPSIDTEAIQNLFTKGMSSELLTNADLRKHSNFAQLAPKQTVEHSYSILPNRKRKYLDFIPTLMKSVGNPFSLFAQAMALVVKNAVEDDLDNLTIAVSRFNWVKWIPENWFTIPLIQKSLIKYHDNWWWRSLVWAPIAFILFIGLSWTIKLPLALTAGVCYRPVARQVHSFMIWKHLQYSHTNVDDFVKRIRDEHGTKVGKALVVLTMLGGAATLWRYMELPVPWKKKEAQPTVTQARSTTTHGTLIPQNAEEMMRKNAQRDLEKVIATEHNWVNVARKQYHASEKAATTARSDLLSMIRGNLLRMEWIDPITESKSSVLILMVQANRGITVGHFAPATNIKIKFYLHEDRDESISSNFPCWIGPKSVVPFGQDCAVVYVPAGGSFKDLTPYFSDSDYTTPHAHLVWRSRENPPTVNKAGGLRDELITNAGGLIDAIGYDLPFSPTPGMCGAALVSEQPPRCILGIHQAGDVDGSSKVGYATRVKLTPLLKALEQSYRDWFRPTSDGVLRESIMDEQLVTSKELHYKSPLRTMAHDAHFEYVGQCPGRATFRSTVHLQPTCRAVEQEFGVTNEWRPPYMEDPWGTTLGHIADASDGIEPDHLFWAQQDYQTQLLRLADEQPTWVEQVRPLTLVEAINGVDGVRFLDPMDLKTAAGFGKYKKLDLLIEDVDPKSGKKTYYPTERLKKEVEYIISCFMRDERCYTPFKLVFKDEPVNKGKMRAFSVGQFAFSLVTRMYMGYLHWLFKQSIEYSECAVGMNVHGPEWDEWTRWHTEYSDRLIFAGDYSKFDLRQSAMVKAASAQLFIRLAEICPNLPDEAILIIRGIFTEKMYPLVAANGDLVQFFGYSPSGVSGTVEENSADNGHLLRCAAHKIKPVNTPKFRDVIKVGTYGDDVRGGVHPEHTWYNAPAASRALATWGYKFTPPDKSHEFSAQWDAQADFLKMTSGLVEGTNIYVGCLDPQSILKPLLAGTKSTLTNEAQSAVNIDGALRDSFAHGRKFYEGMRTKLTRVADAVSVADWCTELNTSYDDALTRWKERYDVQ
jgi:hypothetical protein